MIDGEAEEGENEDDEGDADSDDDAESQVDEPERTDSEPVKKQKSITKVQKSDVIQHLPKLNEVLGEVSRKSKVHPRKIIKFYEEQYFPFEDRGDNLWNKFQTLCKKDEKFTTEVLISTKKAMGLSEDERK